MRPRRSSSAAVPTVLAVVVLGGCVTTDTGRQVTIENQAVRAEAALIAAADPDSLQAAALVGDDEPAARLRLIQRAAVAAPARPDIAWWHLQLCVRVESCDPRPIEAHLQALDPGNGAAWSGTLERSWKSGDTAALQAALLAVSNSGRFGIYWNASIVHAANAVIRTGAMEPKNAFERALGAAAATWVPYKAITDFCQGRSLEQPDVLATCRRLAAVLCRGDIYLTEMIGLAVARRVWPEGSAEYQAAVEARRVAQYRTDADNGLTNHKVLDNVWVQSHLALMAAHDTEQEVVLAELTRAGLNPDPPRAHGLWRSPR
jgi:hypothetical protein